jgi:3-methyladenine DNA glycosylase AlkD
MHASSAQEIEKRLHALADPQRAVHSSRFFKTGKGEYGEGDQFLGITVPLVRAEVKRWGILPLETLERLVASPWHEIRLFGWIALVKRFEAGDAEEKERCRAWLVAQVSHLNNWDFVDVTVPRVLGALPSSTVLPQLKRWAHAPVVWERRIAIISTLGFLRRGETRPSLFFAEAFLGDTHDLIHKATGWVLREVGKVDEPALRAFLAQFKDRMPRTMLRYAIERFSPEERQIFLGKKKMIG